MCASRRHRGGEARPRGSRFRRSILCVLFCFCLWCGHVCMGALVCVCVVGASLRVCSRGLSLHWPWLRHATVASVIVHWLLGWRCICASISFSSSFRVYDRPSDNWFLFGSKTALVHASLTLSTSFCRLRFHPGWWPVIWCVHLGCFFKRTRVNHI